MSDTPKATPTAEPEFLNALGKAAQASQTALLAQSTPPTAAVWPADKTILVHKRDAEGALVIFALDGMIKQPIDERPEWADGIIVAQLKSRDEWYLSRLGADLAAPFLQADAIAYEDLDWVGTNATGEAIELEADVEFRMSLLADVLGVVRHDDLSQIGKDGFRDETKGELAHALVDMDTHREVSEVTALEKVQAEGFTGKTGTQS